MGELLTDVELDFFLAGPPIGTAQQEAEGWSLGIRAAEELRRWREAFAWFEFQAKRLHYSQGEKLWFAYENPDTEGHYACAPTVLEAIEALKAKVAG